MERRTSKLAVAAMIFGFLGFFACTSLAAILLGIFAWWRIRKSHGQLAGSRMALAAIVCPVVIAPVIFVPYAIQNARPLSPRWPCENHLVAVAKAMLIYASDHDDQLPTPSRWCDILLQAGRITAADLQCPGVRTPPLTNLYPLEWYLYTRWKHARSIEGIGACDYAINPYVEQKGIAGEPGMVVLFEVRPGWNQVGGPEAMTTAHHNGEGCNVLFLDGHVSFIKTKELGELRWR